MPALDGLGRYNEAVEYSDKALEIDPKNASAFNNKGNALLKLGKSNGAEEYYDNALEIEHKYADVLNGKEC